MSFVVIQQCSIYEEIVEQFTCHTLHLNYTMYDTNVWFYFSLSVRIHDGGLYLLNVNNLRSGI
jgi:hypothetical protein